MPWSTTFKTLLAAMLATLPALTPAASTEAAWSALRAGGAVALMRHARAPGTGDPPGFRPGECGTQRNLSEGGRTQAAALGTRFRAEGVAVAEVRSSSWCRALDTAKLAFPAIPATPEPGLDSFFADRGSGAEQTARIRALIEGWAGRPGTLVLVSHQVNITALTRVYPADAETVVLRPRPGDGFEVVGTIKP